MESVTPAAHSEAVCSGCLKPSNKLTASSGDQLCEKCRAVFSTGAVLLDENITAEDTLIPTLVFAKIAGGSPEYAAVVKDKEQASGLEIVRLMHAADDWPPQRSQTPEEYAQTLTDYVRTHGYGGWELVRVVHGVPILRVRPLALIPEMHPDTQILKSVRIQVLSRRLKPGAVRDEYERVLIEQGAHWHENNHDLIPYQAADGYLEINAGTGGEVSPLMAESLSDKLLSWPAYNFPPPTLHRPRRGYGQPQGSRAAYKGNPEPHALAGHDRWRESPRPPHAPFYGARHDRSRIPRGQASEGSLVSRSTA